MPRLGAKYDAAIKVILKPRAEYQTDAWFEQDLPVAPAVMVDDEIVTEGADVSLEDIEACIRRHLGVSIRQE